MQLTQLDIKIWELYIEMAYPVGSGAPRCGEIHS